VKLPATTDASDKFHLMPARPVIILNNDPAVSRIVSTRESTRDAPHFENVSRAVDPSAEQSADERHPAARGHDDGAVHVQLARQSAQADSGIGVHRHQGLSTRSLTPTLPCTA
jgi:hypothetical protein